MQNSTYLKAALLLVLSWLFAGCAISREYSAEPIEAWVVDDETGQPIEGVAVVAHWELATGNRLIPHQIQPAGQLMVLEAVTDKTGRFSFPGWGPLAATSGARLTPWDDPELVVFKTGYRYQAVSNYTPVRPDLTDRPVRRSVWNGKTIRLKPYKTIEELDLRSFWYLNEISLGFVIREPSECHWKKMPRMLLEIERQYTSLVTAGVRLDFPGINGDLLNSDQAFATKYPACGSPKEFLKRLKGDVR